jgi:succinyl-diaminopimelate desuccinylase
VQAGSVEQLNVVPAHAWLTLDVRTVPAIGHDELIADVRALAEPPAARHGVRVELSVIDDRPSTEVSADEPVVRALVAAHQAVTGERPPFGGVPGSTDGTILSRDAGLPVAVYGPGGKWIAHQADEHVDVDELVRCADVYAEAAVRFLEGPS